MPRLKQSTADRQQSSVVAHIDVYTCSRRRAGADCENIAHSLGMAYKTLQRRIRCPSDFTLGELQHIANTLNISLARLIGAAGDELKGE